MFLASGNRISVRCMSACVRVFVFQRNLDLKTTATFIDFVST